MRKIDQYVQQMLRFKASSLELVSGRPARFYFGSQHKDTNKALDHGQLLALVKEIASPQLAAELKGNGRASFPLQAEGGNTLTVDVAISSPTLWHIRLTHQGALAGLHTEAKPKPQNTLKFPATGAAPLSPKIPLSIEPIPLSPLDLAEPNALPDEETPEMAEEAARAKSLKPPAAVSEADVDKYGTTASLAPSVSLPPLQPGEPAINHYMRKLIKLGGSDLHLSAGVAPMVRIDGAMKRLEEREALGHDELVKMLFEVMPERNKKEFEETHDTDFAHSIPGVARFRVNTFLDRKGAGTVVRQIPFEILSPEKLGLPKQVLDLCWLSKGLVLVTGPTGSGKSTTLATLVDYINQNREDHIITIEDPIEFVHPNKKCLVNQREINTHTQSFKRALRAALREDPDIVLVGEMRDLETIAIAIETAETGHLVFGTLHTTTAAGTVDRIIDQFPPEQQAQIRVMLSESLRGVIAQMLCKKEGGGRVATYEILITTAAISNLIREGKTFQIPSAMQTGRNLGMRLMNDHLLELVLEKKVAADEAYIKSNDKHGFKLLLKQNNIPLRVGGKDL